MEKPRQEMLPSPSALEKLIKTEVFPYPMSPGSSPKSGHIDFNPLKTGSESYVTTDGKSASLSWYKAPIWGLRPDFYYCQTISGFVDVGRSL
jgi:hypothetical protein